MAERPRIVLDPDILAGKPVVRGTRLAVEFIIGLLADGWSEVEIIANYPGVTPQDIRACLAYARDVLSSGKGVPKRSLRCAFWRTRIFRGLPLPLSKLPVTTLSGSGSSCPARQTPTYSQPPQERAEFSSPSTRISVNSQHVRPFRPIAASCSSGPYPRARIGPGCAWLRGSWRERLGRSFLRHAARACQDASALKTARFNTAPARK